MTLEQFNDIKNRAWNWYRGNMLDWAVKTLKDLNNAPKWVREEIFKNICFETSLADDDFLEQYEDEVEILLVASQERNFKVNYTKELLEYYEAERDNNEYEIIDSLSDMAIVAINAGGRFIESKYLTYKKDYFYIQDTEIIQELFSRLAPSPLSENYRECEILFVAILSNGYDPYLCLLETIKELESRTGAWNEKEGKWIKDKGAYTKEEGREKISKVMTQRYSSLDSVEYIDEDAEYWYFDCEIDDGYYIEEKIKKWYKADYSKCKLN